MDGLRTWVGRALVGAAGAAAVVLTASGMWASVASGASLDNDGFGGFAISVPTPQTAGSSFTVSISANFPGWIGLRCVVFSGASSSPSGQAPVYPAQGVCPAKGESALYFSLWGTATASVTLYDAQSTSLVVKDVFTGRSYSSNSFRVAPGQLSALTLGTLSGQVAGAPFSESISGFDAWGNPETGLGTQSVTWMSEPKAPDGQQASLPSTVSFNSLGVATASITLYDAQNPATVEPTIGGVSKASNAFPVAPGQLSALTLGTLSGQVAGAPFSESISGFDAWGNPETGLGTQSVTWMSEPNAPDGQQASLPSTVSFNSLGVATASITLYDAQNPASVEPTIGGVSAASNAFAVVPSTLDPSFTAEPVDAQVSSPISSNLLMPASVTVTVADAYGNHALDGTTVAMSGPAALVANAGTSETTTGGVASFSSLEIGQLGTYELTAEVGPPTQTMTETAMSTPFQVVSQLSVCTTGSCSASASDSAESASTTMTAGTGTLSDLVLISTFSSTLPPTGLCGAFTPLPGTSGNAVQIVSGNAQASQPSFKITFTIPPATLKAAGENDLEALLFTNICLGASRLDGFTDSSHAWVTLTGSPATYDTGTGYYWGLVPYWTPFLPSSNPAIVSKYIDASGDLVIVLLQPYPWDGLGWAG